MTVDTTLQQGREEKQEKRSWIINPGVHQRRGRSRFHRTPYRAVLIHGPRDLSTPLTISENIHEISLGV